MCWLNKTNNNNNINIDINNINNDDRMHTSCDGECSPHDMKSSELCLAYCCGFTQIIDIGFTGTCDKPNCHWIKPQKVLAFTTT